MWVCACVCMWSTDLLLPVQHANDDQDENTHSDQCHSCQQHNITGSQIEFGTPAVEGERKRDFYF